MNPFNYRPDPIKHDDVEWEDNWLSNALAWGSDLVTPKGCTTTNSFMATISNYLWTSCPCCLFWRGCGIGAISIALLFVSLYVLSNAL